jgi:Recombination directionality factor-like
MAIKPYLIQRRMMELGRVRLGEKGSKGEPRKLTTLRFTSASKLLLDAIAETHGGTVRPWEGAPDEGYFEVVTDTEQIDIILPPVFSDSDGSPTAPYSQYFEQWSGGGCQRRCDGETESISGKPCLCAAAVQEHGEDARTCKVTTRVSFMIPDVPGLGVWRLESHGYNAAVELPGTLEVLMLAAAEHKFIPAVLRIEQRTKKVPGEGTRRFIVPVIELPHVTVRQLASGDVPLAINAPVSAPAERPALPAAPAPPDDPSFEHETVEHGTPPPLPGEPAEQPAATVATITDAQKKKLNILVSKLREGGHITTEQLWRAGKLDPELGRGDDGEIHWSPLRDQLTKEQATALIERLMKLEANVESPFKAPAGVGQ